MNRRERGMDVVAGPSGRGPYLRFPPPPPFPPEEYDYAYDDEDEEEEAAGPSTRPPVYHRRPVPRYQENLYEEIGAMRLEEEVRYVHSKHLQVLDELNLSMEAMIMPVAPGEQLTADLLSPASSSIDSGFSSSSTGTNSLGRPQPTKRKSPGGFWRRLPALVKSREPPSQPAQLHPPHKCPHVTPEQRLCPPETAKSTFTDEPRCNSSNSWEESSHEHSHSRRSSCSDVDLSSGDESNKGIDGKNRGGSKRCTWRHGGDSPEPGGGRLSRWFSMKKQISETEPRGKMPLLPEEDECGLSQRRATGAPSLPPAPPHLSPQQLKMRHIVEAIVQSENSYLDTLHRLVNEYKKPLEEASPAILSPSKISSLFHRVPEILQCHMLFRLALRDAVAKWDVQHRIGDVFVASFSKAVVLNVYSDFINNFSFAMDLARSEAKKKPALAEFFRIRQTNSEDRLSFFGLMVKPVQRFPQFILFLQDLLQNCGAGHPERMALQLALTQLESLAELLNERKREAEQAQAFRLMMRSVSAKMPASPGPKYLIRHDDVTQLEVNQCGLISKCKNRRLLLLNDQLVCVALSAKEENVNSQPRLTYKWSCPITELQVIESPGSPTISRLLTPSGSLASSTSSGTTDSLCLEMKALRHDYDVIKRIHDLTHTLEAQYQEMNPEITRALLDSIQREIQRKDEQLAWLDSCCLQLSLRGKEETLTFQMNSQETRKEWITELRLARLALDPNNSPAWEVPEQELRPSTKMPLFVAAHPIYTAHPQSEVMCGCYYSSACGKVGYLWVCTFDGEDSHVSIAQAWQTSLKALTQIQVDGMKITAIEYVRSTETVWIGTANNRVLIYSVTEPDHPEVAHSLPMTGEVTGMKVHCDNVFVALSTGRLLVFRRHSPTPEEVSLGPDPVSCLLPINLSLYAASGKVVTVMSAITGEMQKSFTIQHEHVGGYVSLMAHSGVGLWISLSNSSTICLYHTETFKHLQDINVASNVVRLTGFHGPVTVTGLMACKGLLWVGTDAGVALTVPLPRLEGVPIISGRVNVSYHGHSGALTLLLPLHDPPTVLKRPPSKALASDVYGLYGQLMYVREEEEWAEARTVEPRKEATLVSVTAGRGYVNHQQCCYKNIQAHAHVVIWEMKL
ncbi:rho guanine nucleotide exchange factor 10 [Halyomorpha halys]|uniref:rho guanine nucleotide exchange factor 10 n=1 Tax=Halyomorpha halys TaxID=286706 RepID=UPI0006D4F2C2